MRKLMLCLLVLLCVCDMACAEEVISFAPQMEAWDSTLPLEVVLSADVRTHMPFDDNRCQQLNALLKHISLRLNTASDDSAEYSRIGVRVDGTETMALTQRQQDDETLIKLSVQPGVVYSAQGEGLDTLLGDTSISIYGLDGNEQAWLDDGYALACAIGASLEDYKKEASIKTAITNMGTARTKITYTIPKADADVMADALAEHCTDGELGQLLTSLVFSGQQKLILWLNSAGKPLRVEYAGNCGVDEEHLRKVSLVWRMRRDESAVRDVITLKTPAVRGTDYNTLTYERALVKGKKSKINYDSEFEYTWKSEKKKTTLSGVVDLTNTPSGKNAKITGTITIKQLLPGEDTSTSFKLKPELVIGQESVSGKVTVQELRGKNILEDADILVEMTAGTYLDESFDGELIDIAGMTEEEQTDFASAMSAALIPHLVLLPEEDVLYLSADLPAETWQAIVEAAKTSLEEAAQ